MDAVRLPAESVRKPVSGDGTLIVSQCYWPEMAGGAPPVQQLADSIVGGPAPQPVTVICARPFYPHKQVFDTHRKGQRDYETHNGVLIERLFAPPPQTGALKSRLWSEGIFAARVGVRLFRKRRATVALAVCPSILNVLVMVSVLPARAGRIAVVHDIQSGLAESLNIGKGRIVLSALRTLERFTLNRVDEIITLSPAMADTIRGLGVTTPIRIIPPTIDDEGITPQPEPDGPITLLYSGNLGRKQGLGQLLDLAALMKERQWPVRLIIRGDGNYRETLVTAASTRALDGVIRFEPFWPTETLSEGLASGHIHLVPQDPVGAAFAVPSKIYAIMAAGRPFICTAEPESPMDQIRRQTDAFLTCPPNDPERLAETVERLLNNPTERARLGKNGRAHVEATAGKAACRAAYLDVISGRQDAPGWKTVEVT